MNFSYVPSEIGKEFHSLKVDEALLGGAAGPGKSLILLMDPVEQIVTEHERARRGEIRPGHSTGWALHLRREFPMLETSISRSKRYFYDLDPDAKYDEQRHTWTFWSGYKFQFGHLKDKDSWLIYRSNEFTHIAYDELGEIDEEQYHEVNSRLRTTDQVLSKMMRIRAASNPWPNWVRTYFVDPAPEGRTLLIKTISLPNPDGTYEKAKHTRIFIPARVDDNPDKAFVSEYKRNLASRPLVTRQALLFGDWYVQAGAFFADEWDSGVHIVQPFAIPTGWTRFRSGDWGYKSPGVILWWAVDPDNNLVCEREFTFRYQTAEEVANRVKEIEMDMGLWDEAKNSSKITGPMDTQLWEERGDTGPSKADVMAKLGVRWEKANKASRSSNALRVISKLKSREGDVPGLVFFNNCRMCIKTIPSLRTDDNDSEAPEKGGDDHWYDAVAYACAHRIHGPQRGREYEPRGEWPEDELAQARNRRGSFGYGAF